MLDMLNATAHDMLDRLDTLFPAGSLLQLRSGAAAGAGNAAGGTLLAEITTPATPWAAAAAGQKAKQGAWSVAAVAAGDIGHFRLKNAGDTHRVEGTVTQTGGGGDLAVDAITTVIGQIVTVNSLIIGKP